jgi:NADH-quinone oxidoreductase subunit J
MTPFHIAAGLAVVATIAALSTRNAVHGLLYFIVSLLAVATIYVLIGAPFAAALEIIIYAGAIMVLFVFAVMVLGMGEDSVARERRWLRRRTFIGPGLLSAALIAVLARAAGATDAVAHSRLGPREVGLALFREHFIGLELASFLLLAGLIAALHLGRREPPP